MTNPAAGLVELDHQQVIASPESYLGDLANHWLTLLVKVDHQDLLSIKQQQDTLFELGAAEQQAFWALNERLQQPLQKRMVESQGGGKVTKLLQVLQTKVIKIKPPKSTLMARLINMFKLLFSWQKSAWNMWLESYPSHKQEISKIIVQLEQCKQQLNRDNTMLLTDKQALDGQIERLKNCFEFVSILETRIKAETSQDSNLAIVTKQLINNEFIQPVQQRIVELQQQLLIARQATLTLELFIHQNESQIRSIEHVIYTTTPVIDVTTQIVMIEHGEKNLNNINSQAKSLNPAIDGKTLKHARHVIDQALNKMLEVQRQSKQSNDELLSKSNLSSHPLN